MVSIVDHVFPPTDTRSNPSTALDFSSFTYWRESLPRISDVNEAANEGASLNSSTDASDATKNNEKKELQPEAENAKAVHDAQATPKDA